ncbi:Molybdate ABC transporter, ATP-binding protein [Nitrospira sp. KM1]|uniref:ABC transporter ATP-binding protein n=1 Tax=Nitrospira sp. KM1 TaxID=1936990 RepID=UPI0013A74F37|nr:ABC transporter ATP-binding protein [Nitrospira sp. KM1]BCA53025.1 Molybdate ABC transporter, ATP-binding protein [Nitrospira sp. KM1]
MAEEMIVDITKTFPGRPPIRASFRYVLEGSTVLILFGPSGSGKTTILRSIAGLERPERGIIRFQSDIWLDNEAALEVSPQDRRVGYMPQDYGLFPNYSVTGNIAYGLAGMRAADREKRVQDMLRLFHLRELEHARPRELSGGQQQRVALARAVATKPRLLLLDEPLSALDTPTRLLMRGELRTQLKHLALPSIIVTHDWAEALTLGDVMAVMHEGTVLQVGSPHEVFSRPVNAEVARIVGVETVVRGHLTDVQNGLATVLVGDVALTAIAESHIGPDVFVCIRAEDVTLQPVSAGVTSARNHLDGRVRDVTTTGALAKVTVDCGFLVSALVTKSAMEELGLEAGSSVQAAVKAGAVHLVPRRDHSEH